MTLRILSGSTLKRAIALMYWNTDKGDPFWVFVAVRTASYKEFQKAYASGKVNLHFFEPYGEIIVPGYGEAPSDAVVWKVAQMYQTIPEKLMSSLRAQPPPMTEPPPKKPK